MTRSACDQCGARIREPDAYDQHRDTCPRSIYFVTVRPFDDQIADPGRRLRIQQDYPLDTITLHDEVVLPECVHRVDARNKTTKDSIMLTTDEAGWMRDRLIELTHGDLVFVALTQEEWAKIIRALDVVSDVMAESATDNLKHQVAG